MTPQKKPTSQLVVCVGDDLSRIDERCNELLNAHRRVSADDGDVIDVITTVPMLGDISLRVTNFDGVPRERRDAIVAAAAGAGYPIVITTSKLDAADKKAVTAAAGTIETFSIPKPREMAGWIRNRARDLGITLAADGVQTLLARSAEHPARITNALHLCRLGGITTPTARQIDMLLGTVEPDHTPWALLERIERDDIAGALELAGSLDAIATLSYLHTQLLRAHRVAVANVAGDAAAKLLGLEPWQARTPVRLAQRLGEQRLVDAIELSADADRKAKTGDARHALDGVVLALR